MNTTMLIEVECPDGWTGEDVRELMCDVIREARWVAREMPSQCGCPVIRAFAERFNQCDLEVRSGVTEGIGRPFYVGDGEMGVIFNARRNEDGYWYPHVYEQQTGRETHMDEAGGYDTEYLAIRAGRTSAERYANTYGLNVQRSLVLCRDGMDRMV